MTNIEYLPPYFKMVVHELGKNHGAILATGECEPADAELFGCLIHSTSMVA